MTTEHTPGPWRFYADLPSVEPNWHIVTNHSRMRVIAHIHIEPGNLMDEANARLIAAAPDLLAALTSLLLDYQTDDLEMEQAVERGFEAIAKARGLRLSQPFQGFPADEGVPAKG